LLCLFLSPIFSITFLVCHHKLILPCLLCFFFYNFLLLYILACSNYSVLTCMLSYFSFYLYFTNISCTSLVDTGMYVMLSFFLLYILFCTLLHVVMIRYTCMYVCYFSSKFLYNSTFFTCNVSMLSCKDVSFIYHLYFTLHFLLVIMNQSLYDMCLFSYNFYFYLHIFHALHWYWHFFLFFLIFILSCPLINFKPIASNVFMNKC
jgi:hypothetical protein